MNNVLEEIWAISQKCPAGFTINVFNLLQPEYGICVAYQATQDSHSRESLERVINHASQHAGYVGGWLDEESNLYYFDSVKVFDESELNEALKFAKEHKQLAIFRLSNQETIIIK